MAAAGDSKWTFSEPCWVLRQTPKTPRSHAQTLIWIKSHPQWELTFKRGFTTGWHIKAPTFHATGFANTESFNSWMVVGRGTYENVADILCSLGDGDISVANIMLNVTRSDNRKVRLGELLKHEKGFVASEEPGVSISRCVNGACTAIYATAAFNLVGYKQLAVAQHAAKETIAIVDKYLEPLTVDSLTAAVSAMTIGSASVSK